MREARKQLWLFKASCSEEKDVARRCEPLSERLLVATKRMQSVKRKHQQLRRQSKEGPTFKAISSELGDAEVNYWS